MTAGTGAAPSKAVGAAGLVTGTETVGGSDRPGRLRRSRRSRRSNGPATTGHIAGHVVCTTESSARADPIGSLGMSGIGKWGLGLGIGFMVVAVLSRMLDLIPATVITGLLGLMGLGIAGYDAVYEWTARADLRRRGARAAARRNGTEGR